MSEGFDIFVKCTTGQTRKIQVTPDLTVWDLKVLIVEKVPQDKPHEVYLIRQGRVLLDETTIGQHKIQADETLMALRMVRGD